MTFFITIAAQLAKAIHQATEVGEVARILSGEKQGESFIQGMQMAAGLAIGTAVLLDPLTELESIPDRQTRDIAAEEITFRSAVAAVQEGLRAGSKSLAMDVPGEVHALFDVYAMLLGSDGLVPGTLTRIRAGNWAPGAWRDTIVEHAKVFEQMARAYRELREEGLTAAKIRVGVMIEVPSAIFLAAALADRADFLSIGTNDLTQYMLAVDRNNAQVVTPYDNLHPAVLNAIHHVIKEAHLRGKPVSVCGEMAGDPAGALLLLGMGVDALSMSAVSFARIKLVIRSFTQQRARSLLDEALGMEDGFTIHRLLSGALEEAGFCGS